MAMPDTAASPASGLITVHGRQPVPLLAVGVRAELSIIGARVTLTQRYINREPVAIEAVYVFPLDEGAAICGFEAIVDGVRFAGEVLERDKAFERYDEAMTRGDGAYLLDEERSDVFTASIGNLPPGREVSVEISYVSELRVTGGEMRFVLPTTVAPRYAPLSDRVGIGRSEADALNPPVTLDAPYRLTLRVDVALPGGIPRLESPSHPVAVSFDGTHASVTLAEETVALDRDFILSLGAASLDAPQTWIEREEDGRASVAVSLMPQFETDRAAADVVFLVDRSGSMKGPSIEQVQSALQICLRALEPGCRFNIFSFGTTHSSLFPSSRLYDDESLQLATEHVKRMDAEMGGTEMLPALRAALESPGGDGLPRQVIVLTDGEVTNTDEVIALAAEKAASARIFTVGIGSNVSHHLVRGLARAGRGSAEFISARERIEPRVVRLFDRLLSPSVTDVRVDWGAMRLTQVPHDLPAIFAGERLVLYGLDADVCQTNVRVTGRRGDRDVAFTATIDPATATPGQTVATLSARARIRELEEHPDWARGSRQPRAHTAATREIIALSTRYRVISRETSFVAIERRETPVEGDVQLRRVPIQLADGWGGHRTELLAAFQALQGIQDQMVMPAMSAMRATSVMPFGAGRPFIGAARAPKGAKAKGPRPPLVPTPPPSTAPFSGEPDPTYETLQSFGPRARKGFSGAVLPDSLRRDYMHKVLLLQRANGTWDLSNALAHHVGIHILRLEDAIPPSVVPADVARVAWATALAIAWCRRYAPHLEAEWGPPVRKGLASLQRLLKADADAWIDAALALFAVVHVKWNEGLKALQD
jgi:Ca-activated chloride channel family protein